MTEHEQSSSENGPRRGTVPISSDAPIRAVLDLERYDELTPKQRQLARFIAENPSFVAFASIAELADRAQTSPATVVRFAQELNFDGYTELQQNLRHRYLGMLRPLEVLESQSQTDRNVFEAQLYQDLQNLRSTLNTLHIEQLSAVADQIHAARQVVIISSGSYSAVGRVLSHLLRFMGYPVMAEDRGGPHLTAAIAPLNEQDLLIGISFWKVVREIAGTLELASQRGVPTVAITDSVYSPMAVVADHSIVVPTEGVSFFQSMAAPLSIAYALVAYLAHNADESRKQIMEEAEESYEQLKIVYQ